MLSKLKNKKIIIITLILLIIAGTGIWALYSKNSTSTPLGPGEINYDPPSEAEKEETERFKEDLENKPSTDNSQQSQNDNGQADVTITYLYYEGGEVKGAGIINDAFEDGGTCTLALAKGSQRVTGTSTGMKDVSKTTCPPISIAKDKLQSGEWSAVLSYSSPTTSGSSQERKINVP